MGALLESGDKIIQYLAEGLMLGVLLGRYLCPASEARLGVQRGRALLFVVLYFFVQMFLRGSRIVETLFSFDPYSTKGGAWNMVVSLVLSLFLAHLLVRGGVGVKCYLTALFYAVKELGLLCLYPLYTGIAEGYGSHIQDRLAAEDPFVIEHIEQILKQWEIGYSYMIAISQSLLLFLMLGILKKVLRRDIRRIHRKELLFLGIPAMVGLFLSIILRSLMLRYAGEEPYFLLQENREFYAIIPAASGLCLVSILLSANIFCALARYHEEAGRMMVLEHQLEGLQERIQEVEHLYDGIRGMKHDLKNYVYEVGLLAREGRFQEAAGYLDHMQQALDSLDLRYVTGNPVTDVVVNGKYCRAAKMGIDFECDFLFPKSLGISAFDLSIILNNALENALEACEKLTEGAFIRLRSHVRQGMFILEVENSFNGILRTEGGSAFLTTKQERRDHGLGLKNIQNCAEKYYGCAECHVEGGVFRLAVMMRGQTPGS